MNEGDDARGLATGGNNWDIVLQKDESSECEEIEDDGAERHVSGRGNER